MTRASRKKTATVLFTCVGRRVELVQAFRAAARRLRWPLRVVGLDSDPTAPALACVDRAILVPAVADGGYIDAVRAAVRQTRADLLVPTIDTDLLALSAARDAIAELGCIPLIGEPSVIETCRDKIRTYEHLRRHGIDTPRTWSPEGLRQAAPPPPFPLFIKPRTGSASQWVHKIEDALDLDFYLRRVRDPIIQEFVGGREHTLDVYVGLDGTPRCVVPRMRWQVRGGEVCKGVVVKDSAIMEAGRRVVETLGTSVRGIVTLQCIVTPERRIRFIEINPRFGGGAPLGIAAGADYPRWLLEEVRGRRPKIAFDGFRHGTCMLRYDWSAFLRLPASLQFKPGKPLRGPPPF